MIKRFIKLFVALIIFVSINSCFMQDLLYPADEKLEVGNGYEIRLHCKDICPSHDNLRTALHLIELQMQPYLPPELNVYEVWSRYAITFRTEKMFYKDMQLLGITLHNRRAIGIWYSYGCDGRNIDGLCPGVFGYEMKLSIIERILPYSNEEEKINWMKERNIVNIFWNSQDFENN
jgi:hypothetical protein